MTRPRTASPKSAALSFRVTERAMLMLRASAAAHGHSLAEEVETRLLESLAEDEARRLSEDRLIAHWRAQAESKA